MDYISLFEYNKYKVTYLLTGEPSSKAKYNI